MSPLFSAQQFRGFGPSRFDAAPSSHQIQGRRTSDLRRQVRRDCPRRPGVYGMVDGSGLLIYVGKAKCLRSRLLSYFRPRSRDPKAGRILSQTRTIVWEHACHEFAALLRELDLIRHWQPRWNVQRQPKRRQRGYVCLGRKPAPYLFLSRKPGPSASVFGPIPSVDKAREAVRYLNDWFRLRDCTQTQPLYFSDQAPLFPEPRTAGCLRYEIGTCLGPCIGASSWAGYQAKIRAARAFLNGTDRALLEALHQEMNQAAAVQAYERAASLRDQYDAIHWLWERLEFLRSARKKHSFIYSVPTQQGQVVWFLFRQPFHLPAAKIYNPRSKRFTNRRIKHAPIGLWRMSKNCCW